MFSVDPNAKTTNCHYEFEVDMEKMKNVKYLEGDDLENLRTGSEKNVEMPLIRILALNVVTTLNENKEHEICMISTLFNPKTNFLHPTADTKTLKPRSCELTTKVPCF